MSEKNNFSKMSIYYLIGTFFQKGIAFLTVPVFTRIMGTDDYGLINTYNSWLAIISMFISSALYMGLRLAFVDYKERIKDFLASITSFAILNGVILSLVTIIIGFISKSSSFFVLGIICVIQATAEAILTDITQFYVMQYRYRIRTFLMIAPPLISAILSIIAIYLLSERKYLGRILPTAFVSILFGIALAIVIYRQSSVIIKKEYIIYGLKISAPLILHGIALNILSSSDRIMITSLRNSSETGIYSLIYNVGMIATAISSALDGIWSPWFIRKMDEINKNGEDSKDNNQTIVHERTGTERINSTFKIYLHFMTAVMVAIVLIGPEIVRILADKRYWEGIPIIPPIVLANYMIFVYSFFVGVEHFYKKTIFISINTLLAAGANIVLNLFFIPKYGYMAAAYTTLASYAISLILHMIRSRKINKGLFSIKDIMFPLLFTSIIVVIFYLCLDMFYLRWIVAFLGIAYVLMRYKKMVKKFLKK